MTVQKSTTGKALVIVESPTKQRTISKILGPNYIVKSSFGHVRDLPSKEIGVDEQHDFKPTYVVSGKPRIIADLKDAVKKASLVYLATDPDREGEAIAWHLEQLLKLKPENTRRIFFHEITDTAIKESFDNARAIDHNLVDAQQARRVLDRLVGYKISPILWRKITSGLSAGRVQSVAVRLLAERAKEIADFKSKVYWTLRAKLEKKDSKPQFFARVLKWQGKNVENTTTYKLFAEDYKVKSTVFDTNESLAVVNAALRKGPITVEKVEKKEVKQHPKPPFITSTLQQDAYNKLGFSPQKTMQTAQSLYEGVEIAGRNVGLITYMRTDSFNVSKLLQSQTNKFIKEKYGPQFAPAKAPVYKGKVKGAQEAHEAIHPTDVFKTPQSIKASLTSDQYKLYELIWLRFVASQMADAVFNTVSIDISAGGKENCLLRANGEDAPHFIYLPESEFTVAGFLADVRKALQTDRTVVCAVSEGVSPPDADLFRSGENDAYGHAYLSGIGKYLEAQVRHEIGCKVRSVELNIMQRCSSHIASATDLAEAAGCGEYAVSLAMRGETGKMVTMHRDDTAESYAITFGEMQAADTANCIRTFPKAWIAPQGNQVTDDAIGYFLPLIQGEVLPVMQNGMPKHFRF